MLPERLLAGYFSRPLVPENFGAAETLDAASGRSLKDWQTFYQGASRLVEYLNHVGYGGQMLTVMADGSTIYPSTLVEPTPRYDNGIQFESAQDPMRKDGLELMLRLFDREGLKLIPSLQFAAPLPELETRLRIGGEEAVGIQLIGPDGTAYVDKHPPLPGVAPYYNPLNQDVQDAMLAVVREVVQRCKEHPSFAGLAVEMSANAFTQLPGELWGLDDATIARFQRETGVELPGSGETRFAQRRTILVRSGTSKGARPLVALARRRAGKILSTFAQRTDLRSPRRHVVSGRDEFVRRSRCAAALASHVAAFRPHRRRSAFAGHSAGTIPRRGRRYAIAAATLATARPGGGASGGYRAESRRRFRCGAARLRIRPPRYSFTNRNEFGWLHSTRKLPPAKRKPICR